MATPLTPNRSPSPEELLISQVVQQEALTRLLMEKGIFSKEEFWDMVRVVDQEMKKKRILPQKKSSELFIRESLRRTI